MRTWLHNVAQELADAGRETLLGASRLTSHSTTVECLTGSFDGRPEVRIPIAPMR